VHEIIGALPELVTTRPRNSILILSDFTKASFDEETLRVMKETREEALAWLVKE
jgi:hypothetical protein